ncbi:MAG: hypothetical protein KGH94_04075 [Candidatus Micrarchaeota archaeon]|nr:hypothetical protein [Candidatus Micrarchaeota archaeon]
MSILRNPLTSTVLIGILTLGFLTALAPAGSSQTNVAASMPQLSILTSIVNFFRSLLGFSSTAASGQTNCYYNYSSYDCVGGVVTTIPPLTVSIATNPPQSPIKIYQGLSVFLYASVQGGVSPYFYQWYSDSSCTQGIPGASNSSYRASPTVTSSYCVRVRDTDSATAMANTVVLVLPPPSTTTMASTTSTSTSTSTITPPATCLALPPVTEILLFNVSGVHKGSADYQACINSQEWGPIANDVAAAGGQVANQLTIFGCQISATEYTNAIISSNYIPVSIQNTMVGNCYATANISVWWST